MTERSSTRLVITGAQGGFPSRLEIYDFVKNEKHFSLYIQALQAMQTKYPPDRAESYFQISGIHGRPYVSWDGAPAPVSETDDRWGGYCTHASVLFPTWHRPYVMLFEQVLQSHAKEIAATYTVDHAHWRQAATELRQPYWDWAMHAIPPPEVISMKQIAIIGTHGKKIIVDNPLYHYKFPQPIEPSFQGAFNVWPTTLRRPTSADADATDNPEELKQILEKDGANVRFATYKMLTQVNTWAAFSNTALQNQATSNSVEAIHNGIHFKIGATSHSANLFGHMGNNGVAAFDPIFYLHHSNVDRMLSLWSALNPGVWVSHGDSGEGTETILPDTEIGTNTPLTPFWNSQNTFWSSAKIEDTTKLGYSYPEFDRLHGRHPQDIKVAIAQKVNLLYGQSVYSMTSPPSPAVPSSQSLPPDGSTPPDQGTWDWTAQIQVKKYELGCSFAVILFLGGVPEDPAQWPLCQEYIGAHFELVNEDRENCANCSRQGDDAVERGFVQLGHAIIQHSQQRSLSPEFVAKYLTDNLHWRVQKMDGSPASLESLEVVIFATPVSYQPGALFPVLGERRQYSSITRGRAGGSREPGGCERNVGNRRGNSGCGTTLC
ncbi:tyrosinase [Flammula alnicola]|nr:tyrosinase [Flammula alnicola]